MKKFRCYLYFIYFLLIANCNNSSDLISNPISEEDLIYVSNFQSNNNGENKYTVDLTWDKYLGNDFLSYEILDQENNPLINEITNQDVTTTTLNMNLNELKPISLVVNNLDINQILIFTRPVTPVANISISGTTDSNVLSWTSSTDNDIQNIMIYRTELEAGESLPLINDLNGNPDDGIWSNIYEYNGVITTYTDNAIISNPNYFYIIKTTDVSGGYRFSFMESNINGALEAGTIDFNINLNPSETIYSNKTSFTWNDYTNPDFYELQIWRSENENFVIDLEESFLIGTFTETIDNFEDYNDVGQGKTWYYKLRIYNIYGNYIDSEYIICNTSL